MEISSRPSRDSNAIASVDVAHMGDPERLALQVADPDDRTQRGLRRRSQLNELPPGH